mmetsp:Transcript_33905/g.54589  ORF Transcript_33905/g.54589 Transcript_33905/m.54589 type:complete len:132 (-) Transcript_33905:121-516(-)
MNNFPQCLQPYVTEARAAILSKALNEEFLDLGDMSRRLLGEGEPAPAYALPVPKLDPDPLRTRRSHTMASSNVKITFRKESFRRRLRSTREYCWLDPCRETTSEAPDPLATLLAIPRALPAATSKLLDLLR